MTSNRPKTTKRIRKTVRHQKLRAPVPATRAAARHRKTLTPNYGATSGAREGSKLAMVISMLRGSGGATIESLSKATGWQAHFGARRTGGGHRQKARTQSCIGEGGRHPDLPH